ncbi:hypothetical protein QLX08_010696 [Tetragonisca angustula]|uniref:Uncharacterized protein n=1 Tax=Tetragonisca angustula TaxID=166442 RepID=A0AAW0ZAY2_9HYME
MIEARTCVLERSEEESSNIHGEWTGGTMQRAFYHLRLASCYESFNSHSFARSSVMPDILSLSLSLSRLLLYQTTQPPTCTVRIDRDERLNDVFARSPHASTFL